MRERIWWYLGALLVLPVLGMAIGGEYAARAYCAGDRSCEFAGMGQIAGVLLAIPASVALVVVVEPALRGRRQGLRQTDT